MKEVGGKNLLCYREGWNAEELLEGLYAHLSFHHEHLVDRPSKARAFCSLSLSHKLNWATKFITEHFLEN